MFIVYTIEILFIFLFNVPKLFINLTKVIQFTKKVQSRNI